MAAFLRETRGAAAVEMALTVTLLTIPLLNITDLALYAYQRMQVENAAQMGAQQAWTNCSTASAFTSGCPDPNALVTAAIRSTSLGNGVTMASGYPTAAYYCTTTAGALSQVAAYSAAQAKCSTYTGSWSDPTALAAGYVQISVTYSFTSAFSGVSVASLLPSPITKTTYTRVL